MATKRKVPAHIREPQRSHGVTFECLDDLVAQDHPARLLWEVLGGFVAAGTAVRNPAFDVTPAALVTALVTERGVAQPVTAQTVAAVA